MVIARRGFALWLVAAAAFGAPPQRIVSTAPSITELLYALGLGDRVVGVTRFCRYPPEAQLKPKIGDYINPNIEAIAALKPDLVVIQTNPVRLADRLNTLHLRSLEISQETIGYIYRSTRIVGDATGTAPRATELINSLRAKLEAIRTRTARVKPVTAMFIVGRSPNRLDGIIVVGRASYLNQVIQLAGGENVFREAVAAYPQVSLEEVIARNPDVIIDMGDMSDTVNVTDQHKREVVSLWSRLQVLSAVKHNRVFPVAADFYVVPGPRVVDAAQAMVKMLHPELP
jgi:iron complex transport system substrate-binding protein